MTGVCVCFVQCVPIVHLSLIQILFCFVCWFVFVCLFVSCDCDARVMPAVGHKVDAGIYVEYVEGLVLDTVSVVFDDRNPQGFWGSECVNTSAAGFPVTVLGAFVCVPATLATVGWAFQCC